MRGSPPALDPYSEPEPDVSVVQGSYLDYRDNHPSTALLVVEISESTLELDRERKGSLYARAGIPEYWILNLPERKLEVYRDPAPATTGRYGWEYKSVQNYAAEQSVALLHAPEAQIRVEELLP